MASVVVDASVLISAMIRPHGVVYERLLTLPPATLAAPRFVIVELFKHKDRIIAASGLSENEILEALHILAQRVDFRDESLCAVGEWMEAWRLCKDVDPKDVAYVALAIHLGAKLWTFDEELRRGLEQRGFSSFFAN